VRFSCSAPKHSSRPCPRPPCAAVSVRALLLCWKVFAHAPTVCSCRRGYLPYRPAPASKQGHSPAPVMACACTLQVNTMHRAWKTARQQEGSKQHTCSRHIVNRRTSSPLAACPLRSSAAAAGALAGAAPPRKDAPASLRRTCSPRATAHAHGAARVRAAWLRGAHARRPASQQVWQPQRVGRWCNHAASLAASKGLRAPQKRPRM